jgi:hypothetical protein
MEVVQWLDDIVESRSEIVLSVKTVGSSCEKARRCPGDGNEADGRERRPGGDA